MPDKQDAPDKRLVLLFIIVCVGLLFYLGLPLPSFERTAPPQTPFEDTDIEDDDETSGELLYTDARVERIDDSQTVHLSNYDETGRLAAVEIVSKSDEITQERFDMECATNIQSETDQYLQDEVYGPYEYQVIEYETDDGSKRWQLRENLATSEDDQPPVSEVLVSEGYAFYDPNDSTTVSYENVEANAILQGQGIWSCYKLDEEPE